MLSLVLSLALASSADDAVAAFKRGRELLAKGRLADACAAFEESHRLDPALGALLNLAECTFNLGNRPRAFALFQEVLAWATRKNDLPRIEVARLRLGTLKPLIGLAVIDLPPDVVVEVDRARVTTGQTVPLDPGPHVAQLRATTGELETRTFSIDAGQTLTIGPVGAPAPDARDAPKPIEPVASAAPPPAAVLPPPTVGRQTEPSRAGPLTLLVAGAVTTVAASIVAGWSIDVWNRGEAQARGGPLTVTRGTYEAAGTAYPFAVAGLIAGPVMAAGGLVWWFLTK